MSNVKSATELGRRALLDEHQNAKKRETSALIARNTAKSDQRVQEGGKGSSTLADHDHRLAMATRDRVLFEGQIRDNATANIANHPKDTVSIKLGHQVVCDCDRTESGSVVTERFVFRIGGFGEEVPNAHIPVCDYTRPGFAKFIGREVGDTIKYPGKGECEIVAILMPFDPVPEELRIAA